MNQCQPLYQSALASNFKPRRVRLIPAFCQLLVILVCVDAQLLVARADETALDQSSAESFEDWQTQAVNYARIMSRVHWTPVSEGIPGRNGPFKNGIQQTGVPYSSVKSVGRTIGFDIYLKTFLAAVENPQSVLYTETLEGKVSNAECYYGKVCSSYTSYALQCGTPYLSRLHVPPFREGVEAVEPPTAQFTQVGDLIFTPPKSIPGGSHIEIVTDVKKNREGVVTHVRVEESRPRTTMNTNRTADDFDSHVKARNRTLCRITDLDAWRGRNRANDFLFPNYTEDSATPKINRALLLDRGDWVVYRKGEVVKFNVMDRDDVGLRTLVIQRGNQLVEEISLTGKGVIERMYTECGEYTAHCIQGDGSTSQSCEFSVCEIEATLPGDEVKLDKSWDLTFTTDNMKAIIVYFRSSKNSYAQAMLYPTDEDRMHGMVTIPAGLLADKGKYQMWVIGENKYGRLRAHNEFVIR